MRKKHSSLITLLIVLFMLLAACSSNNGPSPEAPTKGPLVTEGPTATEEPTEEQSESIETVVSQGPAQEPATTEIQSDKLKIFSWWIAPGEAEALDAIKKLFKEQNPHVKNFLNGVDPSIPDAKERLKRDMQNGSPPDSFQVHAGDELIDWVKADQMEPVAFIFKENEWWDRYPEELIDLLEYRGEVWGVPVNVHRSNVLWYNKDIFEKNGLTPPTTFKDFFEVAEKLRDAEVTPLALGNKDKWPGTHLFESVLLGTIGPDKYEGLWKKNADWNDPEVEEALNNFIRMIEYVNEDHAELSWSEAAQLVADGDAAMTIMGDWTHGYFIEQGLSPDVEYGWIPSPDTEGVFIMLSDSFGLPKDAPNRENAIAWLQFVGTKEVQDTFNPLKGSIPARLDGDPTLYDVYQQSAMKKFKSNKLAPSLAHGAAAPEEWVSDIDNAMADFVANRDVNTAQRELKQACQRAEVCQALLSGEL